MNNKYIRNVIIFLLILEVAIMISVYVIADAKIVNQQYVTEEVSKTTNIEKDEILADTITTLEVEGLEKEERKKIMEGLAENWDSSKVQTVQAKINNDEDGMEMPVPVPIGYTASSVEGENTIDGGFVIYEGIDPVTGSSSDEGVKEAQKTRNQWVWIPVYDPSEIYGIDSNGKMCGKLYNYSTDGKTKENWSESNGVITLSSSTGSREPDIVTDYDKDNYLPNYLIDEERAEINKEMITNFEKTIKSIKKYGGFYIGRYETGGLNEVAKVVKMDTNISNQTWYTMYRRCKELKGSNNNVITSMIYGSQWDRTMQWLIDTKCKSYSQVGSDSTDWGNYYNKSIKYTDTDGTEKTSVTYSSSKRIPSGSSEETKANNIYDLAGNVWEWTLEAYSSSSRRCRGGYYGSDGYSSPADYRDGNVPNDGSVASIRV